MIATGVPFPPCTCGHRAWTHGTQSGFPAPGEPCYGVTAVHDPGRPEGLPSQLRACDCLGYENEQVWPINLRAVADDERLLEDLSIAAQPPTSEQIAAYLAVWRDETRHST